MMKILQKAKQNNTSLLVNRTWKTHPIAVTFFS